MNMRKFLFGAAMLAAVAAAPTAALSQASTATGAAAGAGIGFAVGGPPGAVIGGIIGGSLGAAHEQPQVYVDPGARAYAQPSQPTQICWETRRGELVCQDRYR
jgi:hypothetical protein